MGRIAIIGGGAAGLMAAVFAAKSDNEVVILEKNPRFGRKILASGNGRCNFTNINASYPYYNHPDFIERALNKFGVRKTLDFFENSGLMYVVDDEGRAYPRSYSSSTVLNLLLNELNKPNVTLMPDKEVTGISIKGEKFALSCGGEIQADRVIITVGSRAGLKSGDTAGIVRDLGIRVTPLYPALAPLITSKEVVKGLSGIRVKGRISLINNGVTVYSETGELLFKDDGLSGIAVFNASLFMRRLKGVFEISIDLLPEMSKESIKQRFNALKLPVKRFLDGIFLSKISDKIIMQASSSSIDDIAGAVKDLRFTVLDTYGFDSAQVCHGGVDISEINPETMESKRIKGLYFAGEIIDIDGECGGYNLQWAWTSGAIAGFYSSVRQDSGELTCG
ncbi:MAG: aminoacetone oxidase family FAD-binding enzyme [Christensenellales bacterium]|jgi:predicted Rossmann fold flavoprotein